MRDDEYHNRYRRMVPEGWGLPIAYCLLLLAIIGTIVTPNVVATINDPLIGIPEDMR